MEHAPKSPELSTEDILQEIARLEHEIVANEDTAVRQHNEFGRTPEENADESALDQQEIDIAANQIQTKRRRLVELRDMLAKKAA